MIKQYLPEGLDHPVFPENLKRPRIHDHLCFLYDSPQDWKSFISGYITAGIKKGHRCCYIYDTHQAKEIRDILRLDGLDVAALEASGQLSIIHGRKIYFKNGYFDPDLLIASLIAETERAIAAGHPALRVTFETDWMLHYKVSTAQLLEYESKLNQELFPRYPLLSICQYDRWKFDAEVIKGLLLTHPGIIRGTKVHPNIYYLPPEKFANYKQDGKEAQYWLENIDREFEKDAQIEDVNRDLHQVLNEALAVVLATDENGRYIDCNKAALDFMECSREELFGTGILDRMSQDSIARQKSLHTLIIGPNNEEVEYLINGRLKTLVLNLIPTTVKGRKILYCIGHDITQQKKMLQATEESEKKYRLLYSSMSEGVALHEIITDAAGKAVDYMILETNPAFQAITGISAQLATGSKASELYGIEEPPYLDVYARVARTGDPAVFEIYFPPLQKHFHISVFSPGKDRFATVFADITTRKMAEEQILLNEARLESLLRISQYKASDIQALLDFALQEAIQLTRSKIGYIYHYSEEQQQFVLNTWSKEVMQACNIQDPQQVYQLEKTGIWGEAVRQRKPIILNNFESPHPLKKGLPSGHAELQRFMTIPVIVDEQIVAVVGVANKAKDYDNSDVRQLTLLMDATWKIVERKKANQERKLASIKLGEMYEKEKAQRQELEEEAKARSMFIDVLAHELRTPLTPIMSSVGMLMDILETNPNDLVKKITSNIQTSSEVLARRLEELLDLARYSRGTFKLKLQPVNLNKYLGDSIIRLAPVFEKKKQKLEIEIPVEIHIAQIDPARLEQVIINLLSNASKFSPENGSVKVKAQVSGDMLHFSVEDEGIGITPEEQARLFQPYHRVEQDRQKFSGIGLGLAVAKQLIEAHGGRIWVESIHGKGSTFIFSMPLRQE